MRKLLRNGALAGALGLGCGLVVRGDVAPDLRVGRRRRELGPFTIHVAAPIHVVFDVIADPYLGRTPRALRSELKVLERGTDMVLAEHYTKTRLGLTATTTETVRFERPTKVTFRLVRGPVASVSETFELLPTAQGTEFRYAGELATDLWAIGAWWGKQVASVWERTVNASMAKIAAEAERRATSP